MPKYVLAIDQGTTSSRAVLVDVSGQFVASSQQEFPQYFPSPGVVRHDANEIWESVRDCIEQTLGQAGANSEIVGVGISNQRETTIVWDRTTGEPLAPAIVWQSRESSPWVDRIAERGMSDTYCRITGLVPNAYFSATKLAMLLDEVPGLRAKAEAGDALFGTVDSWLIWNLTGGRDHLTDSTNASRTMLFDIENLEWSDQLLEDLSIPVAMLPTVVPSSGDVARMDGSEFGVEAPIAGIAGDQHAALFGQRCFEPGSLKSTYGTGAFIVMNTGQARETSTHQLLSTIAWEAGGAVNYALEGSVFVAGSAVQWLRDGLGLIANSADVESLAREVPDSGGVVVVPAFVGLGAPYWNEGARGAIHGITRGSTGAHIARATLESIALQVRDVVEAMIADTGQRPLEIRVDGGAAANDLLMQLQADVLDIPIVRPANLETTVLGAAYLAGLGTGMWADTSELPNSGSEVSRFEPAMSTTEREQMTDRWHNAVERSLDWDVDQESDSVSSSTTR